MAYGYGDKIFIADDLARDNKFPSMKDMIAESLRKIGKPELAENSKGKPKGEVEVESYISQSRLVADCPVCNGSMAVNPEDDSFFCMTCHNYKNFNLPIKLKHDSNLKNIEAELLKRSYPQNRNWGHPASLIGGKRETLPELKAERLTIEGGK